MIKKSIVEMRLNGRDACMFDAHLSLRARVTYYRLDFHSRWNGTAYPSQETLSDELGISLRDIQRAIAELRTCGYIAVVRKRREGAAYVLKWAVDQEPPRMADQEFKNRQNRTQEPPPVADQYLITEAGIKQVFSPSGEEEKQTPPADFPAPMPDLNRCPWCSGTGKAGYGSEKSTCGSCRGSGRCETIRRRA